LRANAQRPGCKKLRELNALNKNLVDSHWIDFFRVARRIFDFLEKFIEEDAL
jgi:hypothetical protein